MTDKSTLGETGFRELETLQTHRESKGQTSFSLSMGSHITHLIKLVLFCPLMFEEMQCANKDLASMYVCR